MSDPFVTFGSALVDLSNEMAIYILIGLFFAGLLHELVPASLIQRHLGRDNVASVIKATLFGIPLPVCSCGVIPLATAIKKSGASNGATLSFLISTPITGVDSILATFGMFGWVFTLYRVITSMIIAIVAGIANNYLCSAPAEAPKAAFSAAATAAAVRPVAFGTAPFHTAQTVKSCCSTPPKPETQDAKRFSFAAAMRYGFGTLFGDIAKPLFWGLMAGAAITALVPEDLSTLLSQYPWLSYLIVVAIAVPMYVCATASLPIAASLILAGVAPGAAFVFLSAGPATNTVTIGVVKKMLGTRSLIVYLGTIIAGSILFGVTMDLIFDAAHIDIKALLHDHEEAGIAAVASSVAMWLLLLYYLFKGYWSKKTASCCGS